ncbi:MAG: hypothetical protein AAGA54_34355 [Myxococcota bacterium]
MVTDVEQPGDATPSTVTHVEKREMAAFSSKGRRLEMFPRRGIEFWKPQGAVPSIGNVAKLGATVVVDACLPNATIGEDQLA